MARKSIQELIAQADSTLPDNTSGLISAADVRTLIKDFLNAIAPAYGQLTRTTAANFTWGTTPVTVIFETAADSNSAQTSSSIGSNTITKSEKGTVTLNFTADIEGANGRVVNFELKRGLTVLPWRVSATLLGTGKPVGIAVTGIDYTAQDNTQFSVQVTCDTAGTSVLLSNVAFILSVDPVNSFV
jgi:hypothetical protein